MADITIPPEALEAAKREAAVAVYRVVESDVRAHEMTDDECAEIARAACLAMLEAWEGMAVYDGCLVWHAFPHIILPLTQENTNAEA